MYILSFVVIAIVKL